MPGDTVMLNESNQYFVQETVMAVEPEWSVQVKVFAVWEQENQTINFRLSGGRK